MKLLLFLLFFAISAVLLLPVPAQADLRLTTCVRPPAQYEEFTENGQRIRKHGCFEDQSLKDLARQEGISTEWDPYTQQICRCAFDPVGRDTPVNGPQSSLDKVFGKIDPPFAITKIGRGAEGINKVLNVFVNIIYTVAAIIVLFMIVIGAFQWITSGGDKEAIKSARGRITWAIIGITLLALTFVILRVLGQILGFSFFKV